MRHLIAAVALALGLVLPTVALVVVDSEPAAAHSAITAPAYDVCAWTGVRDGILGFGDKSELWSWRRFWYIDHYWIECVAVIRVGTVGCHKWIVSTHDGKTLHLGDTPCF